jgi:tetratricopeptide (TPR) repeat protein
MPAKCTLTEQEILRNYAVLRESNRSKESQAAALAAADHQSECVQCAAGYLDEFFQLGKQLTDTLSGRPLPGPVQAPFTQLTEYESALLASILDAKAKNQGGVVAVIYKAPQRATALALFARLATRLREKDIPVDVIAAGIPAANAAPVALVLDEAALAWLGSAGLSARIWVVMARHNSGAFAGHWGVPVIADAGPLPSTKGFESFWDREYFQKLRQEFVDVRLDEALLDLRDWSTVPALAATGFSRAQIPTLYLRFAGAEDSDMIPLQLLLQARMLLLSGQDSAGEALYEIAEPELAPELFRAMSPERQQAHLEAWRKSLDMSKDANRGAFHAAAHRLVDLGMHKVARIWLKTAIPDHNQQTYASARALIEAWKLAPREASAWAALLYELGIPLALKLAMEACDREPNNAAVRHTLALLHARRALTLQRAFPEDREEPPRFTTDLERARENLRKLKGNQVAEHSLIQFELETGNAIAAAELFGFRDRRPQTSYWTSLWIEVEKGRNNFEDARDEAKRWTGREPSNPRAWLALANSYAGSDRAANIEKALAAVDAALRVGPGLPAALTLKARILRERGYWNDAAKILGEVLENYAENEHALHSLADMHAEAGRWDEANKYYDRLEDVDPGNFVALISRCDWLLKHPPGGGSALQEVDERLKTLQPPLNDSPFARSLRARLQLARRADLANMGGFRALFHNCADGALRNQLALAYAFLERAKNVEAEILIDARRNPAVRGLNTLAMAYRIQARRFGGSAAPAGALYIQSLELDPDNLYTQQAFRAWWMEIGRPQELDRSEMARIQQRVADAGLPETEPPVLFHGEREHAG